MAATYRTTGLEQIIARLDINDTEQVIYSPEVGVDGDGEPLPFFAFVDTLRLKVELPSLEEAPLPEDFEDLSDTGKRAVLREIMFERPHLIFELEIENDGKKVVPARIGAVYRNPFYHFSMMGFLTDAAVWPVSAGTIVRARVLDVGWGGMGEGDSIDIFGSARTEAPAFSSPPQQVIVANGGTAVPSEPALPENTLYVDDRPVYFGDRPVTHP